jgi:gamma-glutamyltranspeptidase/glutathione hydrolase
MKTFLPILIFILYLVTGCQSKSGPESKNILEGSDIKSRNGMIVSAHPEASRIGIMVLQRGGNAMDAAVAVGFALSVCYPEAGNIGGGGFMVIRNNDGITEVIDYREKAPLLASGNMYLGNDGNIIEGLSTETHLAAGVPGSVDGMIKVHSRYGKLSFREIIQPSIDLAEKGFPLPLGQAGSLNRNRELFISKNTVWPAFVKDSLWKEGEVLRQADLAETLKRIRDKGRAGFYSGKTAELILKEMKRSNGIISGQDLEEYSSVFRKPLQAEYKGYRLNTVPPPSGGGIILIQLLKMVESQPLKEWGFHSAKAVHLIAEAERRAFADRARYSGDPDFVKVPVEGLLNAGYLSERVSNFDTDKATLSSEINAGNPPIHESEQTTHYSVVDQYGNSVAVTTTLNNTFGSSIVVEGAGFLLNNEMDDFSVKPGEANMYGLTGGEANSILPGKRMLSSMTPIIVDKNGKLFLIAGSPGGSTIPTTVFQVIINIIDYNMSISEAVDTGRFHHQWLPDRISFELESIDSMVLNKLAEMGHETVIRSSIGSVNAVQILPDGEMAGAADRRGYNSVCGF